MSQENKIVKEYFDLQANTYFNLDNKLSGRKHFHQIRAEIISKNIQGYYLDVGSGVLNRLYNTQYKGVNLDISYKILKNLKMITTGDNINADGENIPFKKEIFDTVIVSQVIYYCTNPFRILEECYRVLKNNGNIIIITNNQRFYWLSKLLQLIKSKQKDIHSHFYYPDAIQTMLSKTGYENIERLTVDVFPQNIPVIIRKILNKLFPITSYFVAYKNRIIS